MVQSNQIGNQLHRAATQGLVTRETEIALLNDVLSEDGPLVVQIYGISGIGKTTLTRQFAQSIGELGVTAVEIDAREVEPTEAGFLAELQNLIGSECKDVRSAAQSLQALEGTIVLIVDTYEVLRLLDTWLRQTFMPALPGNTRLVLSGREPPVSGWLTDPGWEAAFRSVELAPLSEKRAVDFLKYLGIEENEARKLNSVARGHPLALRLGASTYRESFDLSRSTDRVIDELTHAFLDNLPDRNLRSAVEAVSIVRRVTYSMLNALVPDQDPEALYRNLRELPFADARRDGLIIHDAVREVLASNLKASNPIRYRALRHAAWSELNSELEVANTQDLWRYTADMLYLTENPVIREAFFPSDLQPLSVETAGPKHRNRILEIARNREGHESAEYLGYWLDASLDNFKVVRDQTGEIAGFYCCFDSGNAKRSIVERDPVAKLFFEHLEQSPLPRGQNALILRKWLSATDGEAPSPVQAASWLDIKRDYIAMRQSLRRVYTTAWDVEQYVSVLPVLGFQFFSDGVDVDDKHHQTAVLDFGPRLVLGWMSGIVGAELGLKQKSLLDKDSQELVIDAERVSLTTLEFKVLGYLSERDRRVVGRDELLEEIWGVTHDGSSNVVDAVIRSLRKKLGTFKSCIETIRGSGYRYHSPE